MPIYLDHNATTPVLPQVFEAMRPWFVERWANPSSSHPAGQLARQAIDTARSQVAALIGAHPHEVLFTGTGTEASNLAIRGHFPTTHRSAVVISAIEHPATVQPARLLERGGATLTVLPVDGAGRTALPSGFSADTALVSVMHANNETGVVQPIAELSALAHAAGARMHVDAAQSLGKIEVDVDALGADLLTIAGHKLYAPKGIGALYIRQDVPIEPLIRGAGHERGLRPGTENVPAIVGLGAACALAQADLHALSARLLAQREALWAALSAAIEGLQINGGGDRLPNTLNLRFPGVSGNTLLAACPGLSASTGSACHAHGESASAVILAMGIAPLAALGSVRLSLGRSTTDAELERVVQMLVSSWRGLRES